MSRADHETRPTGGRFTDRGWWRKLDLIHGNTTFLRRRGLDLRFVGILVHRLDAADPGMDLHDHPWAFISIVLRGGYTEEWAQTREASRIAFYAEASEELSPVPAERGFVRTWRRGSIHLP